jgi:hypothetical protein
MKLGNTDISKAYLGITEIKKVILGTTEVWTSFLSFGQEIYTTPGTYSWTAPAGVTSVSVVAVGGGGGGLASASGGRGGGGGGLGWKNNIPVVPGQTYTVVVGPGGQGTNSSSPGGVSYFIDLSTVRGDGGAAGTTGTSLVAGGGFVGDGGGNGGNAGTSNTSTTGGGGGAGGYSGNGGNGGNGTGSTSTSAGQNGTGGGGGGGGGGGSADASGGGGGVGLFGEGANGTGGDGSTANAGPGGGGSGGANGSASPGSATRPSTGGLYGGGGGGADNTNASVGAYESGPGGSGAVRIIWGTGVSYPNNADAPVFSPLVTGTNFGNTETSTFSYPSGTTTNHTVYVWAVAENAVAISLPSDWSSLFSTTITAGGPTAGRLLMKKLYGNESSTSLTLNGGGNVSLFALNGVITENSITEFGVNSDTTLYTNTISTSFNEYFVVMINGDGTTTTPIISQSGLDGFFVLNSQTGGRSIGVGYIGPNTTSRTISITRDATENGFYGITFRVTV